jgi:hypothetical protein
MSIDAETLTAKEINEVADLMQLPKVGITIEVVRGALIKLLQEEGGQPPRAWTGTSMPQKHAYQGLSTRQKLIAYAIQNASASSATVNARRVTRPSGKTSNEPGRVRRGAGQAWKNPGETH